MIRNLGITLVGSLKDANTVTHMVVGSAENSLRRTPKLMIGLCCTPNILHLDWLIQSYRQQKVLNCKAYIFSSVLAEKKYSFVMENSLSIAEKRRRDGGLLSGWNLYFTYNHANNKKVPKQEDLQLIVQAAGGTVLPQSDSPLSSEVNPQKVIVITSDSVLPEKISDSRAAKLVLDGARFFLMRWLFDCITNQELSKMNDIKSYSYYSG